MQAYVALCILLTSAQSLQAMSQAAATKFLQQQQQQKQPGAKTPAKKPGKPASTKGRTSETQTGEFSAAFSFALPNISPSTDDKMKEGKRSYERLSARLEKEKKGSKLRRTLLAKIGFLLPEVIDRNGNTLLHEAVKAKSADSVASLLDHAKNLTVLHKRYPRRVPQNTNGYLDSKNNEGATALHLAVASKQSDVAQQLVEAGASKDIQDNDSRIPADLVDPDLGDDFNFLLPPPAPSSQDKEFAAILAPESTPTPEATPDITELLSKF